ncbi:MAG: dihydroorotate dehydrogenase electron transfer subunit [Clostridiales bacterium]|nr:dihydroorotate dehydrogenase electron transfer subunit [Clostridiales bacterium]
MKFTIVSNALIAPNVYSMRLCGDTRSIKRPGQFVQISVPGFYLRRPISICDWHAGEKGTLDLIYKVVGRGTEGMAELEVGQELDLLLGLGNGYDVDRLDEVTRTQFPLLIGGGVGVPPLYALCKKLVAGCKKPRVILGFNTAEEVFWKTQFEELGVQVIVTTVDGSMGTKGFVTAAMEELRGKYDYIYTCGPEPMLKAVYSICDQSGIHGQYSFEERMACGFGVCMGCSCETKYGSKRICKDGPVLLKEEIIW